MKHALLLASVLALSVHGLAAAQTTDAPAPVLKLPADGTPLYFKNSGGELLYRFAGCQRVKNGNVSCAAAITAVTQDITFDFRYADYQAVTPNGTGLSVVNARVASNAPTTPNQLFQSGVAYNVNLPRGVPVRIAVEFAYPNNGKIARLTYATHDIMDVPVLPLAKNGK